MKTAIVYASSHGTTEKVTGMIAQRLADDQVTIFDLRKARFIDLLLFDRVIIGGSIHAGIIQKRVKNFCNDHMVSLLQKQVALFLCCMNEPEFETQFNNAYPELLRNHSVSNKIIGGEFLFDKMNFIERMLVRKISGVNESISRLDFSKVDELVADLKHNTAA